MNTTPQRERNSDATSQLATGSAAPRGTRWPVFVMFAFVLAAALGAYVDTLYRPRLVDGPLLQVSGPNELTVVWRAQGRALTGGLAEAVSPAGSAVSKSASTPASGYFAGAFGGLKAGQRYEYTLFNTGLLGRWINVTERVPAVPAPPPGTPFRFLAFGDSGNGSNTQRALAEQMFKTSPDLVIHTGDLIYPKGDATDYRRNFFEPYREMLRRVPFMPSLGNHDVVTDGGRPFLDVFTLPMNGPPGLPPERNYWFDFGDARFVALDTNRKEEKYGVLTEADMQDKVAPWLRGVLKECDRRWKFVFFHHPPYTGSTHPAEAQAFVKQIFVPIFDEFGVDMVFCGHNHLYERTAPIRGDRVVEDGKGTIYIVTGAGGASRYEEVKPPPPYMKVYNADVFSFTQVNIRPEALELRQIDMNGNTIDTLRVDKQIQAAAH